MAVINRDDADHATTKIESHEAAIFGRRLQELKLDSKDLARIQDRCGIDKLNERLHSRFLDFVKGDWKQNSLIRLSDVYRKDNIALQALGVKPAEVSVAAILHLVQHQVRCSSVAETTAVSSQQSLPVVPSLIITLMVTHMLLQEETCCQQLLTRPMPLF